MAKKKVHKTLEFFLPFPDSMLSPNKMAHWAKKAKAKKLYKSACCALTYQANTNRYCNIEGKVTVRFTFYPPDNRRYDEDNLIARMKAGIDGIATAIKTDDSQFHYAPIKICAPMPPFGTVKVKLCFLPPTKTDK